MKPYLAQKVYIFLTPDGMYVTRTSSGGYWTFGSVPEDKKDITTLFMLKEEDMRSFIKLPQMIYCPYDDDSYPTPNRHYRKRDLKPIPVYVELKSELK